MANNKIEVEATKENNIVSPDIIPDTIPDIIRVMDRNTKQVIKIDANKCPDFKEKYLHCSGKEFE